MWLQAIISLGLFITVSTNENCKPKSCSKKSHNDKPVCGSDGLTYPNRCHFEKVRCHHPHLTLIRRGPCKEHRTCSAGVIYASQHPGYRFVPNCRPDGSFAAAQCHPDAGFCWCVTPLGDPLSFTSVPWSAGIKHKCGRKKKSTRRSPTKKNNNRQQKPCKHSDKAVFNGNMINIFLTEWKRESRASDVRANDSIVLDWKFRDLDLNNDAKLDKNEYKDLRRMLKKIVKPKRCAKSFARSCDVNSDQNIEYREWMDCLSRDGMDDGRGQNTSLDNEEAEPDYDDSFPSRSPPHGVLSPASTSISQNYDDEDSTEIREDEPAGCILDRQTALAEPSQVGYIPECTSDGRYQKVQCYKSAGYCWCVNEDTGKNIPGTSLKNDTPKCDQLAPVARPMKGCPEEKKATFLKELILYFRTNFNGSVSWKATLEEQAAKISFVNFDRNKNQMLDRNEWKAFKTMVSGVNSLKKCGKKLPRYCDINKDRQISMTEWLMCLDVQQGTAANTSPASTPPSSRLGKKNPLTMLLED